MSNQCYFCGRRTLTDTVILNSGDFWLEFCPSCKDKELTNEAGETKTAQELFTQAKERRV